MSVIFEKGKIGVMDVRYIHPSNVYNQDPETLNLMKQNGIEWVADDTPDQAVMHVIHDSYTSVPIGIIVSYNNKFFKSVGQYSSYGDDEWGDWKEVQKKTKVVEYYE